MKKLLLIIVLLFSKNVFSSEFNFIFDWSDLKNCTSGNPNTVSNPIFYLNNIPKGTKEIIFQLKDLDVPSYNHGGGKVSLKNLKIVMPEDPKFGKFFFKIEPGSFKYKSPCPPDGQHTYSWIASANKAKANSNQKYPATLKVTKSNQSSSNSEDLQKLQDLFDSGVLTEEQFNEAKSNLNIEAANNIKGKKIKLEVLGIPLGGVIDTENQTIDGKQFQFYTRGQANKKFFVYDDDEWNNSNSQPGKYVFQAKKGKEFEGMSKVYIKPPNKKDKMKLYSVYFAKLDGENRVGRIDISPWENSENDVICKKRSEEIYAREYSSGKYQITEEEHAENKRSGVKIIENEDFAYMIGCYGEKAGWLWVWAEDKKLKEIFLSQ